MAQERPAPDGSGGTPWDRTVFTAINVVASDAIEFAYTCTVNSGG